MTNALSHIENDTPLAIQDHGSLDFLSQSEFSSIRTISLEHVFQSPATVEYLYDRRGADYCLSETIKLVKILQSPPMQKYTRRFQEFLVEVFKAKKLDMVFSLESTILLGRDGIRIRGQMDRFHGFEAVARHIGYLGPAHIVFERMIEKLSAALVKKTLIPLKNLSSYSLRVWTCSNLVFNRISDCLVRSTIVSFLSIDSISSLGGNRARAKFWVGQAQDAIRAGDKYVSSIVLPGRTSKGKRESGIYQN
ncbi:hypothetical protein NEOLI_001613 [Neolecta irregularis DAH-3]|uniref:Uncharacterized protein n=1 Tax=Neolecta irregularis (strain DAH-3) TaxID=1198029 RepID=A0A1U7LRE7_NEOID|nr:hypothetical protein NEOLI_001613 [Neolecta irregularis DAH-3]|eukprot:OLL25091.1 hypothetical protein NEOLI_001613 [Neolecta irregularis DAH-3]